MRDAAVRRFSIGAQTQPKRSPLAHPTTIADLGGVGDVHKVIPKLIEALQARS